MKKLQIIICIISMFLFLTGTFSVASASSGYTKTIHIGGNNEVEYTYTKNEEPINQTILPYQNNNTIIVPQNIISPYYNPYTYGYPNSYIYIGYPRTYIYAGYRPNYPIYKPQFKPPHPPPNHQTKPQFKPTMQNFGMVEHASPPWHK